MWNINIRYEERKQHYESIRREVEAYRLARQLGFSEVAALRSLAARFRAWLSKFKSKLDCWLDKRKSIMDDFDAKNHLRDLRREADSERLAQVVEAGVEAKRPKVERRALFTSSLRLLAWMFAQTRRAAR